jgi:hypothetical protein
MQIVEGWRIVFADDVIEVVESIWRRRAVDGRGWGHRSIHCARSLCCGWLSDAHRRRGTGEHRLRIVVLGSFACIATDRVGNRGATASPHRTVASITTTDAEGRRAAGAGAGGRRADGWRGGGQYPVASWDDSDTTGKGGGGEARHGNRTVTWRRRRGASESEAIADGGATDPNARVSDRLARLEWRVIRPRERGRHPARCGCSRTKEKSVIVRIEHGVRRGRGTAVGMVWCHAAQPGRGRRAAARAAFVGSRRGVGGTQAAARRCCIFSSSSSIAPSLRLRSTLASRDS